MLHFLGCFESAQPRPITTSVEQEVPRPVSPDLFRPTSVPNVDDESTTSYIVQGDTNQPTRHKKEEKIKTY